MARRPTSGWLRTIPGFRSGTAWKSVAAVGGYLFLALALITELSVWSVSGILLVLGALVILLVAMNAWETRIRLPLVKSPNKLLAATGWGLFLLVWLAVVGVAAPPSTAGRPHTESPTAVVQSSTATSTPTLDVTVTPSPSPTPLATATPVPSATATPAPRQTPAAVAPTAKPTTRPTQPPPAFNYCGAPVNPWHYNFCGGNVINSPPTSFCGYFNCIPSFWKSTNGYVEECTDGRYSHSGGVSGSCSSHGGNFRPLLAP
jgi:hypothetical protein